MTRVFILLLALVSFLALARAQNTTSEGNRCFLQTSCAACVAIPGCGYCVTGRSCTDAASLTAYCRLGFPGSVVIYSSDVNAADTCANFPSPEGKKCLDTDVNLTNGQLAGIIVGVIVATSIVVPGAIVIVFFIFKAISS